MSELKAKNYLEKFKMEDQILHASSSSATVKEAAIAFNTKEERIAKTLSFIVNDMPIVIVMAGNVKIDNSKFKEFFHEKAKMVPFDDVESLIGHPVGGVCPFGVNENVKIYLDESLKAYETVFPACGETNNAIEITPTKLFEILPGSIWVSVTKNIEN